MTSDDRTTKSAPAPKAASTPGEGASKAASKSEASEPSDYSRGEKQKPVTDSYKDNWNSIFGKKKKTRR